MSATITIVEPDESPLYRVRCSECGTLGGSASRERAEASGADHLARKHADKPWPPKLEHK